MAKKTTKKGAGGRPRLGDEALERRSITATDTQWAKWEEAAKKIGQDRTQFIRFGVDLIAGVDLQALAVEAAVAGITLGDLFAQRLGTSSNN